MKERHSLKFLRLCKPFQKLSTLLQYPEQSNAFERVCVITHHDTNNFSNPVAATHNIDVAAQNVSVYSKSNVIDCAPFSMVTRVTHLALGELLCRQLKHHVAAQVFPVFLNRFSQSFRTRISLARPRNLPKNAFNNAVVPFSNIVTANNDTASRKPFQGLSSNSKEKVKSPSPEFVEISKPFARAHESIIIRAPAPSLESLVFDGSPNELS